MQNIVQFAHEELGIKLFPVQRFVLKLFYGIPLEGAEQTITVPTAPLTSDETRRFTEAEYLHYLYGEGRCNVHEEVGSLPSLCLVMGRRSGKNLLTSIMAAHAAKELLSKSDPQGYFGLPPSTRIRITLMCGGKDAAVVAASDVRAHVERGESFKPWLESTTWTGCRFKPHVEIRAKSAHAKGLRGPCNYFASFEELAFMHDAENVVNAVVPTTASFTPKGPNGMPAGPLESRVVYQSSPKNRTDHFHTIYEFGMREGRDHMLVLQIPTWEINPTLPLEFLRQAHRRQQAVFHNEFGAQFGPD